MTSRLRQRGKPETVWFTEAAIGRVFEGAEQTRTAAVKAALLGFSDSPRA